MRAVYGFHAQYAINIADIFDDSINLVHLAPGALVVHSMKFIVLFLVLAP